MVKKYKFFDKQKVGLQQKSTNNSSIEQVLIGKVVTYAEADLGLLQHPRWSPL